jgi:hypothetical protein
MIFITLAEYMDILPEVEKCYPLYRQESPLFGTNRHYEKDYSVFKEITDNFHFESRKDLEDFLLQNSYEIFGRCKAKKSIGELNKLYYEINEKNDVCVLAQGFDEIIPNTLVFLSINRFICNNIKFVVDYQNIKNKGEFITENQFLNEI